MGICVQIASNGTLVPTGDDVATCPAYVLLSGSEYSMVGTINTAFGQPDTDTALEFFTVPFCLVVFCYMVARGAGSIVNMFRS